MTKILYLGMFKKRNVLIIFSLILLFSMTGPVFSESKVIPIEGMIDLGLPLTVIRGIEEAEADNADYIIFLVNTFGGRVDAATEIKDAIIGTDIKTAAFVNSRQFLQERLLPYPVIRFS